MGGGITIYYPHSFSNIFLKFFPYPLRPPICKSVSSVMDIEKWNKQEGKFVTVKATEEDIESMIFQLDYDTALQQIKDRQEGWAYVEDVKEIDKILQKD